MNRTGIESPYVGLVPYTEEDARFFFGRENDQNVIIANLFAARLTILYGASGVGKSSALRAGVVRELRKRSEQALAEGRAPDLVIVYFNDWKADALTALKLALQKSLSDAGVSGIDAEQSLPAMLRAAAQKLEGDVMFIFDQFEEYFLYHPREVTSGSFAHEFAEAANDTRLPASFLISLRDDALSRLDRFKAIIPNLFSNYLRLRHLTRAQGERSVKLPIEAYNKLTAEERAHRETIEIEPELVRLILEQVRQDRLLSADGQGVVAGLEDAGIETPYLQLVLKRVWAEELGSGSRVLRAATLTSLGGADEIVGTHLETVLSGLSDEEKEICARMFRYMVTPGGTKIAHTVTDLAEFAKVSEDDVTRVLRKLSEPETRIVSAVASVGADGPLRYEIYHDSLAHAILEWCKAHIAKREQEEKDRVFALETERQRKEVEQAQALATAQRQRAEDHARSVRRLRGLVGALVVVLGFLALLGMIAVRKSREANAERGRAETQRQRAEAAEKVAGERADSIKKTQESLAAFADSLFRVSGSAQEAQAFKSRAEQAIAQANALQTKSASDVSVLVRTQNDLKRALQERDEAREQADALRSQIDDAATVQSRQNRLDSGPEATLVINVTDVMALHDGTDAESRWDFNLLLAGSRVAAIAAADYDDRRPQPTRVATSTRRMISREGKTETVTIAANGEDTTAAGSFTFTVRPAGSAEVFRVPVLAANDKKGAFVLFVEVRNLGATAR